MDYLHSETKTIVTSYMNEGHSRLLAFRIDYSSVLLYKTEKTNLSSHITPVQLNLKTPIHHLHCENFEKITA
jgi:hypothetical protein